jgi:hypothetical protein
LVDDQRHQKLIWHENNDGHGSFGPQRVISTQLTYATGLALADLDGDGDVDLIRGSGSAAGTAPLQHFENRPIGDVNDDGVFNSSDLVRVFQAGQYEDGIPRNSSFAEGDFNGDGEFDSSDLVLAFQAGTYESGLAALRAQIAAAVDQVLRTTRRRL